jgi:hypothetical protein
MLGIEAKNCEKTECKVLLDENQGFHIYDENGIYTWGK